ncbi:MAG: VOC family protein [Firmicutes bacterium]|nr:VOC family protein [Bacillota bacterium]
MISVNLFVPDCTEAIGFYQNVFGAVIIAKQIGGPMGTRSIRFKIGGDHYALFDENPSIGAMSPNSLGGTPLCLQVFVDPALEWGTNEQGALVPFMGSGVKSIVKLALQNGSALLLPSTSRKPIVDLEDGSEMCNIRDPFGYIFSLCSQPKNRELLTLDKYFAVV